MPKFRQWLIELAGIDQIIDAILTLNETHKRTNMKLSELVTTLTTIDANLTEASTELTAELQKLRDALANTDIPPDAEAALNNIGTKAKALADVIPNA